MKIIPLGLQCSVPGGIKHANMREYAYPLDWLWSPSKTTYHILYILINNGIDKALEYMTTGYSHYDGGIHTGERFIITDNNRPTVNQMNSNTGLGINHYVVNDKYKKSLKRRLERLITDIKSNENILFIYSDAANKEKNYYLNGIEYGTDATEYLLKIHHLIYPINNNIKIVYFCWNERQRENNIIEYVSFDYQQKWEDVGEIIGNYLITHDLDYVFYMRKPSISDVERSWSWYIYIIIISLISFVLFCSLLSLPNGFLRLPILSRR